MSYVIYGCVVVWLLYVAYQHGVASGLQQGLKRFRSWQDEVGFWDMRRKAMLYDLMNKEGK